MDHFCFELELEEVRTKKSNKSYVIPESQVREFMKDGGPDYTKLCAEALLEYVPESLKKSSASKFYNETGIKLEY